MDEFNERKITIGMITSTDYLKQIRSIYNPKWIIAMPAKKLCGWCIEYFDKYSKAPFSDIEGIFEDHKKGLPAEVAEEIRDVILPSLNEEYQNQDQPMDIQYLVDSTEKYFIYRQLKLHMEEIELALERDDTEQALQLQTTFKPISSVTETIHIKPSELIKSEVKPLQWLVDDLIPKGLTIFAGKGKTGKSYMMLNIATALAQGYGMFDDESDTAFHGNPGNVLYLSLEDHETRLQTRLQAINKHRPFDEIRIDRYFDIRFTWPRLHEGGMTKIEDWLKSKRRHRLVVIDVLANVWKRNTKVSGALLYADEYAVYAPLRELAHKHNTSIIVITHTKKAKEKDVFDEILGGAAIQGVSDNLMVLSRKEGNLEQRVLAIRGKDIEEKHLLFDVDDYGARWQYIGDEHELISTQRNEIMGLLRNIGRPMQLKEIRQHFTKIDLVSEVNPRSIHTLLPKMVNEGLIQKHGHGFYTIEDDEPNFKQNTSIREKLNKKETETKEDDI